MIKYLYANNYKSFVNFKIEFDSISLLIGRNGGGKSNIFSLIASLRDLINGDKLALSVDFNDLSLTRWMKSRIQTFELGVRGKEHEFKYCVEIEHPEHALIKVISEEVYFGDKILFQKKQDRTMVYSDSFIGAEVLSDQYSSGVAFVPQDSEHSLLNEFRSLIKSIIICTPNPKNMRDIVENDVYGPQPDFSNIASAYAGLMQLAPDTYVELSEKFRSIHPGFDKARITVEQFAKYLTFDYRFNDVLTSFHFNELSDGEKMLFALYMLLLGYIKNDITVLLDEPDNYVSLREIQPWCMELEDIVEEKGQCLLISHHPEIVDYLADTRGIWIGRLNSGETTIYNPGIRENPDLLTYSQMISRGLLDEAGW